jgi:hypothetical protein
VIPLRFDALAAPTTAARRVLEPDERITERVVEPAGLTSILTIALGA